MDDKANIKYDTNAKAAVIENSYNSTVRTRVVLWDDTRNMQYQKLVSGSWTNVWTQRDIKLQTGELQIQSNAQTYADASITFTSSYPSTPVVLANITSASTAYQYGLLQLSTVNISTTGFKLRMYNGNASNSLSPTVRWVAFLP